MKPTFQQHTRELARAFNVRLIESDQLRPEEAVGLSWIRVVLCAPVLERMTYAVALHEIGHLAAPCGVLRTQTPGNRTNLTRDEEDAAWAWARHHALEWTPEMEALAQWAEGTYHQPPPAAAPADPAPAPEPPKPVGQHIDWSDWK
jgi:hypothetical protein